jgi:hypothetical protein
MNTPCAVLEFNGSVNQLHAGQDLIFGRKNFDSTDKTLSKEQGKAFCCPFSSPLLPKII